MQLTNDKVLLTVFVTVLVGFLTAAMSIVRLVNDKESKTTDYRQAWNDSLRKCFAELISSINVLAGMTTSRLSSTDGIRELIDHEFEVKDDQLKSLIDKTRAYLDKKLFEEDAHIRDTRRAMHESYALARLHFKPNDLSFARVEQKFDVVLEMVNKLSAMSEKESESERLALREKIYAAAADITGFSRDILKTEWEAVKRGEKAYQRTKFWSLIGGGAALVGLVIFGLATTWSFLRTDSSSGRATNHSVGNGQTELQFGTGSSTVAPVSPLPAPAQSTQTVNVYSPTPPCSPPQRQPSTPSRPASPACKQPQ